MTNPIDDPFDDPLPTRPGSATPRPSAETADSPDKAASRFEVVWQQLTRLGLADSALRIGTHILSIAAVMIVVWVAREFFQYNQSMENQSAHLGAQAAEIPTPTPTPLPPDLPPLPDQPVYARLGILRRPVLHTTVPSRGRLALETYIVQAGDTVFDIAEKFGLQPETVLWGNYNILADDPHNLRPDQELTILPIDGTYYEWQPGDGLNGVARFFGVSPEAIVSWPSNNLDPAALGDYSNPNIEPGSWLVIPGGRREFVTWSAPRITRSDPSVAKVLGPGHCGAITDGPVGSGAFIWPTNNPYIGGYDYAPEANHPAIDIGAFINDPVYAVDSGVVVYAGWNDWGYGNVIVIDHGNGWQSLYAHLNAINVGCGAFVYQGDYIGAIGVTGNSTGPHLHFELMSDQYGKVNPKNFLQ
jgi:hypothetical protein